MNDKFDDYEEYRLYEESMGDSSEHDTGSGCLSFIIGIGIIAIILSLF